ncbi:MAG: VWA domain-containing protein [Myxococcales bacterium]|nr:VWA domain-containing protein [Myxococcota bacterium]MDW8282064.1 VWA domain-containing protein [Myxococcales bacterium]
MQYPVSRIAILSLSWMFLVDAAHAAKCPNLLIVVDRSGSMNAPLGTGTRWTVAKDAVAKVLDRYEGKLPIGLTIFPAGGCNSETPVRPGYKTKAAIKMALDRQGASGSTPSGTAMRDAAALRELRDPERKQYILLITDGGPVCAGEPDTPNGTVNEILKARMQNPPITTFVVGFGGGLTPGERDALTRMAEAGGRPAPTPEKYYKADNAEELNKALEDILEVVQDEFGTGTCDDSCYSNPCPNPADTCIRGECRVNPCAGVDCGRDQYCYTDGLSPGTCVRACTRPCPQGTRCSQGSCISDPCGMACPATTVCDASTKRCIPDPLCENRPPDEQCKGPSRCQFGKCVDDPCRFISCPANTRCVPWDGSCVTTQNAVPPDLGRASEEDPGDNRRSGGCSATAGSAEAAPLAAMLAFGMVVWLAARRRRA